MSAPELVERCETCRFAHHWAEKRRRFVPVERKWWHAFRDRDGAYESYEIEGVQCTRYPETIDVEDDHWCGEYRAQQERPTL